MEPVARLIIVLGVTGSGKTTFISKATGRTDLEIGHGIASCTKDLKAVETRIDGEKVVLLDTPGFDDTERSDLQALKSLTSFLKDTDLSEMLLNGIIILQPVTVHKVQGTERRRFENLQRTFEPLDHSRTVIATTMWSDLADEALGSFRVEERKQKFWNDMIEGGARVVRHNDDAASAINIVRMLIPERKAALQMQELDNDSVTCWDKHQYIFIH